MHRAPRSEEAALAFAAAPGAAARVRATRGLISHAHAAAAAAAAASEQQALHQERHALLSQSGPGQASRSSRASSAPPRTLRPSPRPRSTPGIPQAPPPDGRSYGGAGRGAGRRLSGSGSALGFEEQGGWIASPCSLSAACGGRNLIRALRLFHKLI